MNTLQIVFLVIFMKKIYAQNTVRGACPDVGLQPNFNATAFAGRWFEYARIPRESEAHAKCVFFEYIPPVDARITVNRRLVSEITNKVELKSAQATVLSPGQAISADFFDYRVVKTDYHNYATVYACKNQDLSSYHLEMLWIITRAPFPMKEYVEMAYEAIADNHILAYDLFKVDQKNCPPAPAEPLPTKL